MTDVVKLPELTQINGHLLAAATGTLTVNQVDGTPGPAIIYGDEAAATVLSSSGVASWVQGVPDGWVEAGHTYDIFQGATVVSRFEAVKASAATRAGQVAEAATGVAATDTTRLQAKLTAAAGGKLTIPPGSYTVNATLVGLSRTHVEIMDGATINYVGPNATALFDFSGTEATPVTLTSSAAAGATAVAVAAGAQAGFAVDDWVRVGSGALYGLDAIPIGEIAQVLSTSSGTVTFRSPLMGGPYNTTDSAFISKITPVEDITITGSGTIRGKTDTTLYYGVRVDRGHDVRISGVRFESVRWIAVQLTDVVDFTVENIFVNQANFDTGYGVSVVNACQGGVIANSHFRQTRHPTSINALTTRSGIPRHITIHHCISWDNIESPVADAFDTHAAAEHISYLYNTAYDSTNSGFNIECPIATLIGNTSIRAAKYGIAMLNRSDQPTDWTVRGNKVISSGDTSIRCLSSGVGSTFGSVIRRIEIMTNSIIAAGSTGIRVESTSGLWDFSRVKIDGNTIVAPVSHGINPVNLTRSSVSGNEIYEVPAGLSGIRMGTAATKCKVIGNLVSYAVPATVAGFRFDGPTDCVISGNVVEGATGAGGIGITFSGTAAWNLITGNDMRDASTGFSIGSGTGNHMADNLGSAVRTITAASTITLGGSEDEVYKIGGTTTIDTITATGMTGRRVTLVFTSTAGLSDGVGNLKLASAFVGTPDDVVSLLCDGTNWFEISRSAN